MVETKFFKQIAERSLWMVETGFFEQVTKRHGIVVEMVGFA